MSIPSDTWVSSVTQKWYGNTLTSDQFEEMWRAFLASDAVRALPANATVEEYHRLYLQFIADQIIDADPWFAQITRAAYQSSISDAEIRQLVRDFLKLKEVLAMPQPATAADYHRLYLRYLTQIVLSEDEWFTNATFQFYGQVSDDELEQILLDFLASPEVLALPSDATVEDYQRLYVQYLSSEHNKVYLSEAATSVSPEQIEQSKIMMKVFDLLADMISTSSIAQIRSMGAVMFLTKKREEYGKMLSQVPLYIGTGTVDLELNDHLVSLGLLPVVTRVTDLVNGDIPDWDHSLFYWYNDWYNDRDVIGELFGIGRGRKLKEIDVWEAIEGCVNIIEDMGVDTALYHSPPFYAFLEGDHVIVIKVEKTGDNEFTAYAYARDEHSTDEEITNWKRMGTFTKGELQIVKVKGKHLLMSDMDSVFTPIFPNTDPEKFYLGYGGISLADISASFYNTYITSAPDPENGILKQSSFTLYSGDWVDGDTMSRNFYRNRLVIDAVEHEGELPTITVTLYQDKLAREDINDTSGSHSGFAPDETVDWSNPHVTTTTLQTTTGGPFLGASDEQAAFISSVNTAFADVWNDATAAHQIQLTDKSQLMPGWEQERSDDYTAYAMNARDPKIEWSTGILGSEFAHNKKGDEYQQNTLYSLQAQVRAQNNQRSDAYMSAINSRLEMLSNITDQQQQTVDTSSSVIKMTNNMINAIIQQMTQILNSIFK